MHERMHTILPARFDDTPFLGLTDNPGR